MPRKKFPFWVRFVITPPEGGGEVEPPEPSPNEDPQPDPKDEELGANGLKALHAERAARAAAEKDAREAHAALAAERTAHAAAIEQAQAAEISALKVQVAVEQGIPPNLASRLVGVTREDLVEDAKSIKEALKPGFTAPTDPSQGQDRGGDRGGSVESGRELFQRMRGKKSK